MKFDYSLLPLLKGKGKGIVVTLLNDINNLGDKKTLFKKQKNRNSCNCNSDNLRMQMS